MVHILPASSQQKTQSNIAVEAFFLAPSEANSISLRDSVREQLGNMTEFLIATRRALHRTPELMYQEKETSTIVQSILTQLGVQYTTGWAINTHPEIMAGPGGYGIVADIGSGGEPCVLLRADMDALPIFERTEGIDHFRSRNDDRMHACGHDGHTTMLLGAAAVLKSMESSINGTVRLMFQPAEEGGAGAKRMREEGVLQKDPKPQHAFGLHLWPTLPSGVIAGRPGPLLAACERFEILIAGVGGHAAMPHLTVDPIVTASSIIMNLQTIVSRNVNPLESGVCTITKFDSGDAFNIIPASALLRGTIRALSTSNLLALRDRVHHIVETTAAVYGCNVTITYSADFYPPTVNDPELYESFSKHVGGLVAADGVAHETEPTMGAEDFSFIAESIPSTFFLLGQGSNTDPPSNYGLHHPHFAIDESVLPRGAELHVNLAIRAIQKLQEEGKRAAAEQ
jgi:amidohydrolase